MSGLRWLYSVVGALLTVGLLASGAHAAEAFCPAEGKQRYDPARYRCEAGYVLAPGQAVCPPGRCDARGAIYNAENYRCVEGCVLTNTQAYCAGARRIFNPERECCYEDQVLGQNGIAKGNRRLRCEQGQLVPGPQTLDPASLTVEPTWPVLPAAAFSPLIRFAGEPPRPQLAIDLRGPLRIPSIFADDPVWQRWRQPYQACSEEARRLPLVWERRPDWENAKSRCADLGLHTMSDFLASAPAPFQACLAQAPAWQREIAGPALLMRLVRDNRAYQAQGYLRDYEIAAFKAARQAVGEFAACSEAHWPDAPVVFSLAADLAAPAEADQARDRAFSEMAVQRVQQAAAERERLAQEAEARVLRASEQAFYPALLKQLTVWRARLAVNMAVTVAQDNNLISENIYKIVKVAATEITVRFDWNECARHEEYASLEWIEGHWEDVPRVRCVETAERSTIRKVQPASLFPVAVGDGLIFGEQENSSGMLFGLAGSEITQVDGRRVPAISPLFHQRGGRVR